MGLLYGTRILAVDYFLFVGVHAFDGQTNGQTDFDSKNVRMHSQSHVLSSANVFNTASSAIYDFTIT